MSRGVFKRSLKWMRIVVREEISYVGNYHPLVSWLAGQLQTSVVEVVPTVRWIAQLAVWLCFESPAKNRVGFFRYSGRFQLRTEFK